MNFQVKVRFPVSLQRDFIYYVREFRWPTNRFIYGPAIGSPFFVLPKRL